MNYFRLAIFFIFIVIHSFVASQDKTVTYLYDPHYKIPDREFEIYHTNANLVIHPYDTLVEGEVEFSFKTLRERIDSLVFDVTDISVSEVRIDNQAMPFRTNGGNIIIEAPENLQWQTRHKLLFIYTAKPAEGLYFIGWNDPARTSRKQIWAHRPNRWMPYTPSIHTIDMAVTVPGNLKVFSNGVREDVVTNKDNSKTWIYKMNHPHPFFSTCLVIGDYEFKTLRTKRGLPVELWYYPEFEDHFETTYIHQTEMFDFFEEEFDFEYPWELYRQAPVSNYMYAAMETTTATIFGDFLMVDERAYFGRNYVNVNAHELAHQWFGNYISHLKHKDVWLTESFATYWGKMFEKHVFGADYYQNLRNLEMLDAFEGSRKNNLSVGHSRGGRERIYQKGSLVLDMLRDIMGDREFKAVMKYYLETYPYQTAETNDFLQAIRKVSGRSMEWFFEQWIYRGGEPEYEISHEQLPGEVRVDVEQIHEKNDLTGLFEMPFVFEVHYKDGSVKRHTEWIRQQHQIVSINNPDNREVEFLIFDPNRKVLKKVKYERTYNELIAQAAKAGNMIDRYDAILELRSFPSSQKTNELVDIYAKETFHLTKNEILFQVAGEWKNNDRVKTLIRKATGDPDDKVRMAALQIFPVIPQEFKDDFEELLSDKSYFNVELALQNLCRSFPGQYGSYLDRTADETGWRGKNIRISWLEIAIERGGTAFVPELKNYTSESHEFETRINAMQALQRLNILDAEIAANMMQGLFHWNRKISSAARETLAYFYKQNQFREIIQQEITRRNLSDKQLHLISRWFGS
jgi:aminopeptidase N